MQRLVVLALGLALALSNAAVADDADPGYITNPVWTVLPAQGVTPAAFSNADYQAFVPLFCHVQRDVLSGCRSPQSPLQDGFLDAAISAASAARIAPQDGNGRDTADRDVFLIVNFPPPAAALPNGVSKGIFWRHRPTAGAFERNYPAAARATRQSGLVNMDCWVAGNEHLTCTVVSEAPTHYGFGDAAIALVPAFVATPQTSEGHRLPAGRVHLNLNFNPP
ncbi:MAG TPA: hypothetical protein VHC73_12000 [Vitreimonas sp.]|jgi:TonB family protein|nr:hypothetical protein [Vitreimonas sp.]